jgi:formate dehydrogenase accessory protein FdhE
VLTPNSLTREYDAQLRRAETLGAAHPASKEVLAFYAKIVSFQKTFRVQIAQSDPHHVSPGRDAQQFASIRDSLDLAALLPHFRPFLSLIEQHAPKPLANAARELSMLPASDWITLLTKYWQTGALPESELDDSDQQIDPFTQFFPRAFLQPYAAHLASRAAVPPTSATPNRCPLCGAVPLLGVLRPEGDGAKRALLCAFCSTEWNFRRIVCPHCGETEESKLPVYIAEQFPHIRTETCDTCRTYLRTIDLAKDGHAVPVVDDLAALPLSLWAHEHGYSRPYLNLLSV